MKENKLLGTIACSCFIFAGAWIASNEVQWLIKGINARYWPKTDGVITTSDVREDKDDPEFGPSYYPNITYDYRVNGVKYTGHRVRMHNEGSTSNLADARTLLKLYFPVGKAVTVFYSPDDPADSVLKPGVRSWDWFFLAVAGFFLIVPSFFLILILFVPSKDQKSQSDPIELTAKANFDTATE